MTLNPPQQGVPWHRWLVLLASLVVVATVLYDTQPWVERVQPQDVGLPQYAREVVRLRTSTSYTFRLGGRRFVTISRGPGNLTQESGTGSTH